MKYFSLLVLCLLSLQFAQGQVPGITYQAVIMNPEGQALPGVNNPSTPLAEKEICLKFSFINATGEIEYEEVISTKTDAYGMVNVIIGTGERIGGKVNSFDKISWNSQSKNLEVALDKNGQCADFKSISIQQFTAVPFAMFALNSGKSESGGSGGKSAYQVWLDLGNTGSEQDFIKSLVGPAGPKGDQGSSGPQGVKGDQGVAGPKGETGATGPQGLKGDKGDPGIQGPKGDKGEDGTGVTILGSFDSVNSLPSTGKAGDSYLVQGSLYVWNPVQSNWVSAGNIQGPKGDKGETGAVGPQGLKGDQGIQGVAGPKGDKGDTGADGAIGPQGLKGDMGDPGIQGPKGDTGAIGPQGLKGDQGIQGIAGPKGDKGDTGADGAIGPQGPKGDKGDTGATGPQGLNGDNGKSAYQIWLDLGNSGTEENFIQSLTGPAGSDGQVVNGFKKITSIYDQTLSIGPNQTTILDVSNINSDFVALELFPRYNTNNRIQFRFSIFNSNGETLEFFMDEFVYIRTRNSAARHDATYVDNRLFNATSYGYDFGIVSGGFESDAIVEGGKLYLKIWTKEKISNISFSIKNNNINSNFQSILNPILKLSTVE